MGNTALVIGGSGGLGRAICRKMAQAGWSVCLTYRTDEDAALRVVDDISRSGGRARSEFCDLTEPETIRATASGAQEWLGPLGAVIFASGAHISQGYVSELSRTDLSAALDVDVIGFFELAKATLPLMRQNSGGAFVALSSIAVHSFPPRDGLGAIPKAAVEMLCRAIAKEEGRFGIRANAVAPGFIDAGLGQKFMEELYTPSVWDRQRHEVPLRRFGKADEIADAVEFLASERAKYISGQTLRVDGGFGL
ncbi:SDR family NAD(P)-dependent oxidoreductase [Hoeflea alexandrii]|uniref:SDR family NAD(P)-dependent oxidoreductase n=1 Tax=Hoeflea alexandrii TaxID=288436 RepID=UPI0022B063B4|nr:SDR family NAD(P)-dependent oxidoreductase [Hoeflea alexandrii]MCZ4291573.1 SDR family NAD(P)-dependent oxidoreductase [Hoeflea alexandrii]